MDVTTLTDQEIDYYIREYGVRIGNGIALDDSKLMLDYLFDERNFRKRSKDHEEHIYQNNLQQRAMEQGADPNTFVNNETINLGSEPLV